MTIVAHFFPPNQTLTYKCHLWRDHAVVDLDGVVTGDHIDFTLPITGDARDWQFKFRSTDPATSKETWEGDEFTRRIRVAAPTELWAFESSGRLLYKNPLPPGVTVSAGQIVTIDLITANRYVGGKLYVWDPYHNNSAMFVGEHSRTGNNSTFSLPLAAWMTTGFHFKFVTARHGNSETWEPDALNRVWRPVDGDKLFLKSGQLSVRHTPLALQGFPVEVLFPATVAPPKLDLYDPFDDANQELQPTVSLFAGSSLFKVGIYSAQIYPDSVYTLTVHQMEGDYPFIRPFPSPHGGTSVPSRLVVGLDDWVATLPTVITEKIVVQPLPGSTAFAAGLNIQASTQLGPIHETVAATAQTDGTYVAQVAALADVRNALWLKPVSGNEHELYAWIDKKRFYVPSAAASTCHTTEGVFGTSLQGPTKFGEPTNRKKVMEAAFGKPNINAGIFPGHEMPHGPTVVGGEVYFVVHAPHAVNAALILVDAGAAGGPQRLAPVPMQLTKDTRYWWCRVPATVASPGIRYRFLLNGVEEVLDPAAREVFDSGDFETSPADNPSDPSKSWTVVLDEAKVRAAAHQAPWDTMGWDALLVYEMHVKRFTSQKHGQAEWCDVIAHYLRPGEYLHELPVTALELLPVNEFKTSNSWGYNTAFYFAIDGGYGGAPALARLINAAHGAGKGVILDVVYNHSLDSPLMKIARDVYRNGDNFGDKMNSGHPVVIEFLRQAIVYHFRTFGLDGFRFDDTKTILANPGLGNAGGWDFLRILRDAVRMAAAAEGKRWPYCVAENDLEYWNASKPGDGVMDGTWHLDEAYRVLDCSYDVWHGDQNHVSDLAREVQIPQSFFRPFMGAARYSESHDFVSGQEDSHQRIAKRPPFGLGFQLAKAFGALPLLSNGVPMLFMGQEVAETRFFSFDNNGPVTNPQAHVGAETDQTRVLAWFSSLIGLRNDNQKGLRGDSNVMSVATGHRTLAFSCGAGRSLFVVVTFGTANQRQDSGWLGLPGGSYKEIFNSSWPVFQVESEPERTNGGYDAQLHSGDILNLPYIGAVVLERR
ncbi:MAG: 1,4-alpha-glucan branching protein [Schlesneria sp.]|nr:1,4-alpha-glucan branching protein [Schlesneria sp.]